MHIRTHSVLLALILAGSLGCGNQNALSLKDEAEKQLRPRVFVTNYPLKYFAQRIGSEFVDVQFPMLEEGDPAFWQPDAQAVARYQNADLILINGATYEKWIDSATLPEAKIIDTSAGFRDKFIQIEHAETHSHGPEGEHSHSGTAFTTWIDFDQAAQQAIAIRDALAKMLPDRAAEFDRNLDSLRADLQTLDQGMKEVSERMDGGPLVASHPVYHYWARRYGLNLKSVLWEPDVVPSDDAIAELKKILETNPAKVMIWEGSPDPASVEKLKAVGLGSVVFDPCGNLSEAGTWLDVMRANINSLRDWTQIQ